jgi:hypothetical protein
MKVIAAILIFLSMNCCCVGYVGYGGGTAVQRSESMGI